MSAGFSAVIDRRYSGTAYSRGSMKDIVKCLITGLVIWALTSIVVFAQTASTAQITGTVTDPSGAVLPGAEVAATQTDTGISRNAISNETGTYVLPNLPVGPYRLEVSLPGFRSYVRTGIVLQVNSNPLINVTLQVGQVTETVEVQANAALVETRSTGVGTVIENQRILELPLNGRQATDLIFLAGAAVQTSQSAARVMAWHTRWMGRRTATFMMRRECRCRFRMRSRSSRWRRARRMRSKASTPARQSTA